MNFPRLEIERYEGPLGVFLDRDVAPVLPPQANVVAWHEALVAHLGKPGAVHVVRRFGRHALRGKLVTFNGVNFVSSDNEPAVWSFCGCYRMRHPEDLISALVTGTIPVQWARNRNEHGYERWGRVGPGDGEFAQSGWKLSHLLQCSPEDLSDGATDIRIRCLRLLSPFNHLPTPKPVKKTGSARAFEMASDWGENEGVLTYVTWWLANVHYQGSAREAFGEFVEAAGGALPRYQPPEPQIAFWQASDMKGPGSHPTTTTGSKEVLAMAGDWSAEFFRALNVYARFMRDFVKHRLIEVYGNKWWDVGVAPHAPRSQRGDMHTVDAVELGRIIVKNFDKVFSRAFPSGFKIIKARIEWIEAMRVPQSHQRDGAEKDILRAIQDMADILQQAGLDDGAKEIAAIIKGLGGAPEPVAEPPSKVQRMSGYQRGAVRSSPPAHGSFIPRGETRDSKDAFGELLKRWLVEAPDERTIGNKQEGERGGVGWVFARLPEYPAGRFRLNKDSTRDGIDRFVKNNDAGHMTWHVVENQKGKFNKVTNDPARKPIAGLFFYHDPPALGPVDV